MPETLCKQPSESFLYDMNFSSRMATSEVLTGITSVTESPSGLTIGTPTYSGQIGQVRISGGTDGVTYTVTWLATTDAGNTIEAEGFLYVFDSPGS